jgi:peptidoglycan biosynthesis protein MviN/MurJ (putative lipid II flippase)
MGFMFYIFAGIIVRVLYEATDAGHTLLTTRYIRWHLFGLIVFILFWPIEVFVNLFWKLRELFEDQ